MQNIIELQFNGLGLGLGAAVSYLLSVAILISALIGVAKNGLKSFDKYTFESVMLFVVIGSLYQLSYLGLKSYITGFYTAGVLLIMMNSVEALFSGKAKAHLHELSASLKGIGGIEKKLGACIMLILILLLASMGLLFLWPLHIIYATCNLKPVKNLLRCDHCHQFMWGKPRFHSNCDLNALLMQGTNCSIHMNEKVSRPN